MVAYVKNNFLLVPIVVLLLFVVSSYAKFSTKVTTSEIRGICTHRNVNASFCYEFMKSYPQIATMDISDLAKFLINYDFQKTLDLMKHFQSLTNSTTDRSSKESYKICSELFSLGIHLLESSLKALATNDYDTLDRNVSDMSAYAEECGSELSSVIKPIPQLLKGVSIVENVGHIVLVILECFLRKEKTFC
ncbi:pectinesterase inhibitor [Arabidopsis lyrata subsp. lyrata]|nr:pectinesterase inhibitor [Arabidopsis lyrata subsp. lyrata]|eukprot:XP_002862238.2 pectinesterase inhibitor [Arabidopsis lyrata subsp. lyrata]